MKTNSTSACFASGAQTLARWLAQFLSQHSCRLAALAALVLIPYSANAAVTEAWVHRFSNVLTNAYDQAVKVVSDAKGDIIVTGVSQSTRSDVVTIKYSGVDGSILWQQRYAASGDNEGIPTGLAVDRERNVVVTASSEVGYPGYYTAKYAAADGALLWEQHKGEGGAQAVAVDGGGNVVVTGFSPGNGSDFYTAKYAAADGALLWERRYNGPTNREDRAKAVTVDSSGNVVVTGTTWNVKDTDGYTAKYAAADGALLWENRYHSPNGYSSGDTVAVDDKGNAVVTGTSESADGQNYYTAKYAAADGVLLWKRSYNTPWSTTLDQSGNLLVAGYGAGNERGFYTAKYAAANGALLWEKQYDTSLLYGCCPPPALGVDRNGSVLVTAIFEHNGNSASYTAKFAAGDGGLLWAQLYNGQIYNGSFATKISVTVDDNGNVAVTGTSAPDYYTVKYAAEDGSQVWEQRYNGPAKWGSVARAVAVDRTGNVAVTGHASNVSDIDYYTAKYAAANGALLWERRYQGPGNGEDIPAALALDRADNVVVTGYSFNGTNIDFYTAKYAATDGALFWAKRGPRGDARALVLDGADNVVVIGSSFDSYGQFYTAKYAAVDGALLWERRYGSLSNQAYATAVAVDGSNNVVVTGTSATTRSNNDFYTAKYSAADGSILWETRYDGPANLADEPQAIALDGHGNVMVTGRSETSRSATTGSNYDYYTAKYAAVDGSRLWERRYHGPAGQNLATALAVDGGGNVVVIGSSAASGLAATGVDFDYDYYTAKYAAADGALLWDKRYNGPANGIDRATGVAMDDGGNVVVTGASASGFDSSAHLIYDYYTAKYAAADGALLWEQRFDGLGNRNNWLASSHPLALGPNGMVIVTGSSSGDYTTVVYREALPSLSVKLLSTEVRLTFTGKPGQSYFIQRAPAVTGPWGYLGTLTATLEGLIEFIDLARPSSAGFYRTTTP